MYLFIYRKLYNINNIFLKRKFNYCRCCLQRGRCFVWIFVCAHYWFLILGHILSIVTAALSNYSNTAILISPGLPAAWSRSSHPPATCYPWVIHGSVSMVFVKSRPQVISQKVMCVERCFWYRFQAYAMSLLKNVNTVLYSQYFFEIWYEDEDQVIPMLIH